MEATHNIHTAITAVIRDLPSIGKASQMTEPGAPRYRYRGIDDIMPHIKRLLAKHQVYVTPSYTLLTDELGQTAKGRPQRRVVLNGRFTFTAADGSHIEAHTFGEAMDMGDKAFNKAMTAAYKYALVQTFAIAESMDDPDDHYPQIEAATPNYDALKALGPALKDAKVDTVVKEHAESIGADLRHGHDDASLEPVVAFARELLADSTVVAEVES